MTSETNPRPDADLPGQLADDAGVSALVAELATLVNSGASRYRLFVSADDFPILRSIGSARHSGPSSLSERQVARGVRAVLQDAIESLENPLTEGLNILFGFETGFGGKNSRARREAAAQVIVDMGTTAETFNRRHESKVLGELALTILEQVDSARPSPILRANLTSAPGPVTSPLVRESVNWSDQSRQYEAMRRLAVAYDTFQNEILHHVWQPSESAIDPREVAPQVLTLLWVWARFVDKVIAFLDAGYSWFLPTAEREQLLIWVVDTVVVYTPVRAPEREVLSGVLERIGHRGREAFLREVLNEELGPRLFRTWLLWWEPQNPYVIRVGELMRYFHMLIDADFRGQEFDDGDADNLRRVALEGVSMRLERHAGNDQWQPPRHFSFHMTDFKDVLTLKGNWLDDYAVNYRHLPTHGYETVIPSTWDTPWKKDDANK